MGRLHLQYRLRFNAVDFITVLNLITVRAAAAYIGSV